MLHFNYSFFFVAQSANSAVFHITFMTRVYFMSLSVDQGKKNRENLDFSRNLSSKIGHVGDIPILDCSPANYFFYHLKGGAQNLSRYLWISALFIRDIFVGRAKISSWGNRLPFKSLKR